jgi:hypothetical protein
MDTRIVEATNGFNHGKFLVGRFTEEWSHRSVVENGLSLLRPRWMAHTLFVMDLETGEGALFTPGGLPRADLDKHRIWVCPMFEPFLAWLYGHVRDEHALETLPQVVRLTEEEAPSSLYGYRRPGPDGGDSQS